MGKAVTGAGTWIVAALAGLISVALFALVASAAFDVAFTDAFAGIVVARFVISAARNG